MRLHNYFRPSYYFQYYMYILLFLVFFVIYFISKPFHANHLLINSASLKVHIIKILNDSLDLKTIPCIYQLYEHTIKLYLHSSNIHQRKFLSEIHDSQSNGYSQYNGGGRRGGAVFDCSHRKTCTDTIHL